MNIVKIHHNDTPRSKELGSLFDRMEASMRLANADFEKSVRLAKTLAPILNDQSSNVRHLETINSDASVQEKVIAILMLGFPKNRALLPALQDILHTGTNAMRMASAMAIAQMRDGNNNDILCEVLLNAYHQEAATEVKSTLRQTVLSTLGKRTLSLEIK